MVLEFQLKDMAEVEGILLMVQQMDMVLAKEAMDILLASAEKGTQLEDMVQTLQVMDTVGRILLK